MKSGNKEQGTRRKEQGARGWILSIRIMIRTLIILWSVTFFFALPVVGQEAKKVKVTDLERIIAESKGPLIINFLTCRMIIPRK